MHPVPSQVSMFYYLLTSSYRPCKVVLSLIMSVCSLLSSVQPIIYDTVIPPIHDAKPSHITSVSLLLPLFPSNFTVVTTTLTSVFTVINMPHCVTSVCLPFPLSLKLYSRHDIPHYVTSVGLSLPLFPSNITLVMT